MGKTSARSDGESRADRKFEKKMQFYESVRSSILQKTISKEKQQRKRSRQKMLRAFDMSTLSEHLPELRRPNEPEPKTAAEFKLTNKTRNKLVMKESNQLKTVLNHPVFQTDPLGSIYQHLLNTQPPSDEKKPRIRKDGKTRRIKAKKKKPQSQQQAMEI